MLQQNARHWHTLPILPHAFYAPLVEQFPHATFKPVGFSLLLRMLPNSEEELALVRYAATVGDEITNAMLDVAKPGSTDADVLAAGMAAGYLRGSATAHPYQHRTGCHLLGRRTMGVPASATTCDR